MSNDSSTGGPLTPIGPVQLVGASGPVAAVGPEGPVTIYGAGTPAPLDDQALDVFLQNLVVGLTGIAGANVRPRFQPTEPNLPPQGTDWAAIGVVDTRRADTFPYIGHDGAANGGDGQDTMIRHEELEVLCSFYGPNAGRNAALVRDGLLVPQNREPLFNAGMALVAVNDCTRAPALLKNIWTNRWDIPFTIRRAIERVFPVLNLESVGVTLTAETSAGTLTSTISAAD